MVISLWIWSAFHHLISWPLHNTQLLFNVGKLHFDQKQGCHCYTWQTKCTVAPSHRAFMTQLFSGTAIVYQIQNRPSKVISKSIGLYMGTTMKLNLCNKSGSLVCPDAVREGVKVCCWQNILIHWIMYTKMQYSQHKCSVMNTVYSKMKPCFQQVVPLT